MRALTLSSSLLLAFALVGCETTVATNDLGGTTGGDGGSAGGGKPMGSTATSGSGGAGGSGGAAPDLSFPAPHPGMPQIPDNGGAVLHDPVIVTVTWPNDPLESFVQGFDAAIGTLSWWGTTTSEYGVNAATDGGDVSITDPLPAQMMDTDIQAWIESKIGDGTLPPPTDQTIYALYIPSTTSVSFSAQQGGGSSCTAFYGYHDTYMSTVTGQSIPVAYASINRCGPQTDELTITASHEFAEAATDPHPVFGSLGYMILDNTPWTLDGGEVGDMCAEMSPVTEGPYTLQRIWSNKNAAAGNQPCIPVPPDPNDTPYFNAGIAQDAMSTSPGTTLTTKLDCYSFGPLSAPMTLSAQPYSPDVLTITFDKPTCENGDVVTMTIKVSATATPNDYHYDLLTNINATTGHLWRGMVTVD